MGSQLIAILAVPCRSRGRRGPAGGADGCEPPSSSTSMDLRAGIDVVRAPLRDSRDEPLNLAYRCCRVPG